MIRDLVFLTESPFDQRDHGRFGIELLREHFTVRILDCTPWLKPEFWAEYAGRAHRCEGYVAIDTEEELGRQLGSLGNTVVIDFLSGTPEGNRARREVVKRRGRVAILHNGLQPVPATVVTPRQALRAAVSGSALAVSARDVAARFGLSDRWGPTPDIIVLSGAAGLSNAVVPRIKHHIRAHSFDYDTYLASRDRPSVRDTPYAVFLDEDMPYHSDWLHSSRNPPVSSEAYYASMNRHFRAFEREHGLPVVIAAHPRSDYASRPDCWDGRVPVYGQTCDLVRDAAAVLCHESTSVSYAVLFRKPVALVTTAELAASFVQPAIDLLGRLLRTPVVDVDAGGTPVSRSSLTVNESAFEQYAHAYIKMADTPQQYLWTIVAGFLKTQVAA